MSAETSVPNEIRTKVGRAWREIRRGASAVRIKDLFYGMGPDGLDMAIADALTVLVQTGTPMRMGELAEALRITPASTTRAVDCLVEKGLAIRVKAEDDQRSILVSVTEAGQARQAIISERIQVGLTQILSEFSAADQVLLADFLDRFAKSIEHYVISQDMAAHDGES